MKDWMGTKWGELCGLALSLVILGSGRWFHWWWWSSWEGVGYSGTAWELWAHCCEGLRAPPGSPGTRLLPCLAGTNAENLQCALLIAGTGWVGGGIFTVLSRTQGPWHQQGWWAAAAVGTVSWLTMAATDAGHNVEYPAFWLAFALLISAGCRQMRAGLERRRGTGAETGTEPDEELNE